jgi:hypothetical protein
MNATWTIFLAEAAIDYLHNAPLPIVNQLKFAVFKENTATIKALLERPELADFIESTDIESKVEHKLVSTMLVRVNNSKRKSKYYVVDFTIPKKYGAAHPIGLTNAIDKSPKTIALAAAGYNLNQKVIAQWGTSGLDAEYESAYNDLHSDHNWTDNHRHSLEDIVRTLGYAKELVAKNLVM